MTAPATIIMIVIRHLKKPGWGLLVLSMLLGFVMMFPQAMANSLLHIDEETLKKAVEKCGSDAPERLIAWEELVRLEQGKQELEILGKINLFFNKLAYVEDVDLWGVKDYWATPVEFLCRGAGDCEDYAIAKYFTLIALGISEQKLKITYVKALQQNRSHMVLAYYSSPGDEPLILDNLIDSIKPASQRADLSPIFSFNGSGLWMAQQRGRENITSGMRIKKWDDLLKKMSGNRIKH